MSTPIASPSTPGASTATSPSATPSASIPAGALRAAQPDAPRTLGGLVRALLGHWSPRLLVALVLATWSARLALGGWGWLDAALAAGIVALWPLQEWVIHVAVLHFRPRRLGPFTFDLLQARRHRAHHRDPWRLADVFVPLHTFLYALPILLLLAWVGWPTRPVALTGIAVYVTLGLHYEWCHLMAHSNYAPRTALYNRVWRNHRLHHFKNETLWMGVSTALGDRLLGTCPDPKAVERSATCRDLGVAEPAR